MRDTSRFEPGLFSISCKPITFRLTGLSTVARNGDGRTVTASSRSASSSSSTSMKGVAADTIYSGVVTLLYPTDETASRQMPGFTRSMRNLPSESVEAPFCSCPASTTAA